MGLSERAQRLTTACATGEYELTKEEGMIQLKTAHALCGYCGSMYPTDRYVICPYCMGPSTFKGTFDPPDAEPELPGVESTLAERSARYGAFQEHAAIVDDLIQTLEGSNNWKAMPAEMKQALRVIMDKAARMCTGDFTYTDNWHDIVGYGKLGEKCAQRYVDKQKAEG